MNITLEFLKEHDACSAGMKYVTEKGYIGLDRIEFINRLISDDKLEWANWLIVLTMTYKQYVSYAVFAAEQVINIFEKKYPEDKRPRNAIEAAKRCIGDNSEENRYTAAYTASAAHAAARAADDTTDDDAHAAASAAYAAAYTAAYTDDDAAAYTASYAAYAADMRIKILNYGLSLIESE